MFKILQKQPLAINIDMMVIRAPHIARNAQVGNFVVMRLDEKGERIPLTIADSDAKAGTITILFQKIGKSTQSLGLLTKGGTIKDVAGPLGHPTPIKKYGKCVLVGGGIGAATLYPITRALKEAKNRTTVILGARSKDYLIWEERFRESSDELLVSTDDGSYGRKGFVTDVLKEIVEDKPVKLVIAVGPVKMMEAVSELTRPYGIKTMVSLNPLMVEGTGMCGSCRVTVSGQTHFACIDGPEFDGHEVDFKGLENRLGFYREEEETAYKLFIKKHKKGSKGSRGQGSR
jgi:ferredoxin--NADP+ reductase